MSSFVIGLKSLSHRITVPSFDPVAYPSLLLCIVKIAPLKKCKQNLLSKYTGTFFLSCLRISLKVFLSNISYEHNRYKPQSHFFCTHQGSFFTKEIPTKWTQVTTRHYSCSWFTHFLCTHKVYTLIAFCQFISQYTHFQDRAQFASNTRAYTLHAHILPE